MNHINVHFLELFYYVARHGGVNEAVQKMPYGIGRSALNAQLKTLEEQIGVPLLHRRPFALTPAGQRLWAFIRPFFEELDKTAEEIREGTMELIRLAASRVVLSHPLSPMLKALRRAFPRVRLTLRNGPRSAINQWFAAQEIDVALTILEGPVPLGCAEESLVRLPLQLLVPRRSRLKSAAELWRRPRQTETLICPEADDAISRAFRAGLLERGIQWPLVMEVVSMDLIENFVADGFGVGLTVAVPGHRPPRNLRVLPLPDFPRVDVGLLWRREPNRPAQVLMDQLRARARSLQ